jgi:hypothetical protein
MCIFCLLSSFKKGGKIQRGLNCEYDGLSEVCSSLKACLILASYPFCQTYLPMGESQPLQNLDSKFRIQQLKSCYSI